MSVSILCQFEDGADWTDWDLGVHGIRIEWYSERGNRKTATFLPEVPLSQGWDKTQTIDSLLRKGGFKGVVTPDVRRSIRLVRYQSEMTTVTYQDYVHHCRSILYLGRVKKKCGNFNPPPSLKCGKNNGIKWLKTA